MRLAQKEARILGSVPARCGADGHHPHEDEHGYVYLQHGDVYRIFLKNYTNENNDVIVEIDGKEVGGWRLGPYQAATLERPADDSGQFTFYEIGSREARQVGLNSIARTDLGLVKVTFIPEKPKRREIPTVDTMSYSCAKGGGMKGGDWSESFSESFSSGSRGGSGGQSVNLNTRSAGGTGLSGQSNQKFGQAGAIKRDYDRQVAINLRLVAKQNDDPRPLRAVDSTVSNMVPPPVN